jgi:hypothetical protein
MRATVPFQAHSVKYFVVQSYVPGIPVTTFWLTLPSYIAHEDRSAYSAVKRLAGSWHPYLGAVLLIQEGAI